VTRIRAGPPAPSASQVSGIHLGPGPLAHVRAITMKMMRSTSTTSNERRDV
jgi:hypothetical protein